MSLAWMTVDHRAENWPCIKPTIKSRVIIAWWSVRAWWKSVTGFITGLIVGLALLNLIEAPAEQEIILDFTTAPAITALASAEDPLCCFPSADTRARTRGAEARP